jgi:outer membrane protein assembly factor BamA
MVIRIAFVILSLIISLCGAGANLHSANPTPATAFIPIDFKAGFPVELLPEDYIIVSNIELDGNVVTQKQIINREIIFSTGDTLFRDDIAFMLSKSRENLLNTSLFNFVEVGLLMHETGHLASIRFTFVERWYIWPFPIFEIAERNLTDWLAKPSLFRTNYGFYVVMENFRGRMERIRILARFGYKQTFALGYTIPYINKNQTIGVSLNAGLNRRNEVDYMTRDNIQLFYSEEDAFALNHFFASTQFFYRRSIHNRHNLILEFNQYRFADSLLILNPLFSPGSETVAPFFSLGYEFRHDFRDVRAYPLRGYYFDFRARKQGLGILPNEKMDITTFETSARKFIPLSTDWFYSTGVNAKITLGDFQPYYLQQGLGFKGDIVRGYDKFVIDGQHFVVMKNNFKYALFHPRNARLGFIPNDKFALIHYALYMNLFADMGYARDNIFYRGNPYSNKFLLGGGIGFDLVTYYDKVIRTEFSLTRQGDLGFQLHLTAPI